MMPCRYGRRMALGTSIVLLISAPSLTVGCTSARRGWSTVGRLTPHARGTQAVPGDWERIEALRVGTPLVVTLKSGHRIIGEFKALHPTMVAIIETEQNRTSPGRTSARSSAEVGGTLCAMGS